MRIHETAIIDSKADLADDVEIGPYCSVGPMVKLGPGTRLLSHVLIQGETEVAEGNVFHPFATVGTPPQDLKYRGGRTRLKIGSHNVFREYVNLNVGTEDGGGLTEIGSHNLIMAYAHVAHDCRIGDHTILANAATLAGHVTIGDYATVGAFSGVHQFCRIGQHAFIGGYSVVTKDALPFLKTVGNRARVYGVNTVGLRRRGFQGEALDALKQAYRILFHSRLNTTQALARLRAELEQQPEVRVLIEFIEGSRRGVVKR